MNKTPITLITGFLGSGKTTFLRRYINEHKNKNILYLINDFSPNDVDGTLFKKDDLNLKTILGGSIFCNCLITEFTEVLKSILDSKTHFEEIIVETSGITNPLSANKMLNESGFGDLFMIQRIISIVDSVNFIKLEKSLTNIQNQIKSADTIIINKIDLVNEIKQIEIKEKVEFINSNANILFSKFCNIDLNVLNDFTENKKLDISTKKSGNYSRFSFKSKKSLNYEKLKTFVSDENESIFRIKGYVNINDELYSINYSSSGWDLKKMEKNVNTMLEIIFLNNSKYHITQKIRKNNFFKS